MLPLLLLPIILHLIGSEGSPSVVSLGDATTISPSAPIPQSFVSFSIEFAFFPDYAGISFRDCLSIYVVI